MDHNLELIIPRLEIFGNLKFDIFSYPGNIGNRIFSIFSYPGNNRNLIFQFSSILEMRAAGRRLPLLCALLWSFWDPVPGIL